MKESIVFWVLCAWLAVQVVILALVVYMAVFK